MDPDNDRGGEAQVIVQALGGRWYGQYGVAFCPAHDNTRTPALRVSDGEGGRLLLRCSVGCTFEEVLASLRSRGLAPGNGKPVVPDPAADQHRAEKARAERTDKIRRARAILDETVPATGTLAERYLRARAIAGPLPVALRFHRACWHGPSRGKSPALVAAVAIEGEAAAVAIHRTWLAEPDRKAAITPNRMMLGPCQGGAVRLSEGTGPLVVAEGIETALSLRDELHDSDPRVWAALSTSGVRGLRLPAAAGALVIAPDGDPPGEAAAHALAERAHAAGWAVRILPPPGTGRDWNDVAMETRNETA
ncbi:hypothetical protein LNKW23_48930 [Paralimibaculum aggregatum]|uniref:Toprim domain-containing protein n=1 Tax=Paralimibaculum aggregatum TaxID=3036245 RepID=A0ABQ6LUB6_9RHOB|nr:toprim domain-containing protein [Limibaculum sp. NKW23]GMG85667.1 hypothetical protein LNKW23_48930 [Limibaculum sp. NKW23]